VLFLFWLDQQARKKARQRLPRSYPGKPGIAKTKTPHRLKVLSANLAQSSQAPEKNRVPIKKTFFKGWGLQAQRVSFVTERRIIWIMALHKINQQGESGQTTN
jgi:hypothetical protein